jgi:hypothetical protein
MLLSWKKPYVVMQRHEILFIAYVFIRKAK